MLCNPITPAPNAMDEGKWREEPPSGHPGMCTVVALPHGNILRGPIG